MKYIQIIFILIFTTSNTFGGAVNEFDLDKILNELYNAYGDTRIEIPSIKLQETKEYVASYKFGSNQISIESAALDACNNTNDPQAALAFIIGHELGHAFQEELHDHDHTSFLAYHKALPKEGFDPKKKETEADNFGAFGAFIAGYNIKPIMEKLISELYEAYGLSDKLLPQYPSQKFRSETATLLMNTLDSLVNLYEVANVLSMAGKYDEASNAYELMQKYYGGTEVLNSIASNSLLQAVNISKYNVDKYYYPIEINFQTRLHKAVKTRGTKDLEPEEFQRRQELCTHSINVLDQVLRRNPKDLVAMNNKMLAHIIRGESRQAIVLYHGYENYLSSINSKEQKTTVEITYGIALLNTSQEDGIKQLESLKSKCPDHLLRFIQLNLGESQDTNSNFVCSSDLSPLIDKMELHSSIPSNLSTMEYWGSEFSYWSLPNSTAFKISDDDGEYYLVKQKKNTSNNDYQGCVSFPSKSGQSYLYSAEDFFLIDTPDDYVYYLFK